MRKVLLAGVVIGLGLVAPGSLAAALFSFKTPLSQYSVTPGQTVAIEIYFQETLTEGTPSKLVENQGLIGAGVRIDTLSIPLAPDSASYLANLSQFIPSPEFAGGTGVTPLFLSAPYAPSLTPSAYLLEMVDFDQDGLLGEALSSTQRQVYLGKIILTAGSAGETVFQATTLNSQGQDFVWGAINPNPTPIGAIAPAQFTLKVVPEPALFVPLSAAALLLKRRKSR